MGPSSRSISIGTSRRKCRRRASCAECNQRPLRGEIREALTLRPVDAFVLDALVSGSTVTCSVNIDDVVRCYFVRVATAAAARAGGPVTISCVQALPFHAHVSSRLIVPL